MLGVMMPVGVRAQDAGKIVEQYIKAEGGAGRLSKVQTLKMEGTFSTNSGGGDVEASGGKEKNGTYTLDYQAAEPILLGVGDRRRESDRGLQREVGMAQECRRGKSRHWWARKGVQLEAAAQY